MVSIGWSYDGGESEQWPEYHRVDDENAALLFFFFFGPGLITGDAPERF
jgi:hypothetical protein